MPVTDLERKEHQESWDKLDQQLKDSKVKDGEAPVDLDSARPVLAGPETDPGKDIQAWTPENGADGKTSYKPAAMKDYAANLGNLVDRLREEAAWIRGSGKFATRSGTFQEATALDKASAALGEAYARKASELADAVEKVKTDVEQNASTAEDVDQRNQELAKQLTTDMDNFGKK